jgi:hypothetical protein
LETKEREGKKTGVRGEDGIPLLSVDISDVVVFAIEQDGFLDVFAKLTVLP